MLGVKTQSHRVQMATIEAKQREGAIAFNTSFEQADASGYMPPNKLGF
jgi:hypothetical protein